MKKYREHGGLSIDWQNNSMQCTGYKEQGHYRQQNTSYLSHIVACRRTYLKNSYPHEAFSCTTFRCNPQVTPSHFPSYPQPPQFIIIYPPVRCCYPKTPPSYPKPPPSYPKGTQQRPKTIPGTQVQARERDKTRADFCVRK